MLIRKHEKFMAFRMRLLVEMISVFFSLENRPDYQSVKLKTME